MSVSQKQQKRALQSYEVRKENRFQVKVNNKMETKFHKNILKIKKK